VPRQARLDALPHFVRNLRPRSTSGTFSRHAAPRHPPGDGRAHPGQRFVRGADAGRRRRIAAVRAPLASREVWQEGRRVTSARDERQRKAGASGLTVRGKYGLWGKGSPTPKGSFCLDDPSKHAPAAGFGLA
jgi:hypothetical protein